MHISFFEPSKIENGSKITKIGGKQTNYTYSDRKSREDAFSYPKCYQSIKIRRDISNQKKTAKRGGKHDQKIPENRTTFHFCIICSGYRGTCFKRQIQLQFLHMDVLKKIRFTKKQSFTEVFVMEQQLIAMKKQCYFAILIQIAQTCLLNIRNC